jgi:integrase/recombinase XerD
MVELYDNGMAESSPDLRRLAQSWDLELRSQRKSPLTLSAYRTGVRQFLDFSPTLDKSTVIEWTASLEHLEPATVRLRLAAIKQFAKWLDDEGYLDADPIMAVRPPKLDQKSVPACSEAEITAMIKACGGNDWRSRRDRAILLLLAETGMRAGELLALDVVDVDLSGCLALVRRGKGAKGRWVRFSPTTAAAIDRYLRAVSPTGALWRGRTGGRLSYTGLRHSLALRATRSGVMGFHVHRLRHSAAVRWLAKGGSESGLMAQAGWQSRDMIDRYIAASKEKLAAEEFDRLGLGLTDL